MEHIAVSVIVPIYNAEPWLEECVQSILDQDFPASYGTVEVLLIDDGATDGSGACVTALPSGTTALKWCIRRTRGFPARATPALIWPAAAIMPLLTATMWCARRT